MFIRSGICKSYGCGLFSHLSYNCGFYHHILSCSFGTTIGQEPLLNITHNKARKVQIWVMLRHPLPEKLEALHIILTQFIWVSVGVLELLHRHSPGFLQLELQISHLFILQLTKIFLHLNTLLQGRNMFFVIQPQQQGWQPCSLVSHSQQKWIWS